MVKVYRHNDCLLFRCPHCTRFIEIEIKEINCGIFRHGVFKDFQQISPHEIKSNCDDYFKNNLIYGCGKPFQVKLQENKYLISPCDYI